LFVMDMFPLLCKNRAINRAQDTQCLLRATGIRVFVPEFVDDIYLDAFQPQILPQIAKRQGV
ncbi:MAG: hypothetical protein KDI03_16150, partial [Anaerolineae bacterium]|nr:hypothetical protein [Anaerolineae bacterium]